MEIVEDIVIVGAGFAGLITALGLHRLGIQSLVLESSDRLRVAGFGILTWTNAWKALDAVGVGDSLRQQHRLLHTLFVNSIGSNESPKEILIKDIEVRGLKRKLLVEALAKELPEGRIRYSSKVVSIEESGHFKLLHLADGSVLKTKVLIGCEGVNSVVAKWLGFKTPVSTGRSAIRACFDFEDSHGFGKEFFQFFGNGIRSGFVPCDDKTVYWFLTWRPTPQEKEIEDNPAKLQQFALKKLEGIPDKFKDIIRNTELDNIMSSPLRYRHPWEMLWGNISKGNVCVAGDALHPMTPDIGQGGCSALEDGVILARSLAGALSKPGGDEWRKIEMGLERFARERRWRSFELISTAYTVGAIQQSSGKLINFLREKFLTRFLAGLTLRQAGFDCGKLSIS